MNPRRGLRLTLFVAGVLPALLVLAFALKVALMLQANSAGRDAFDRGDYDGSVSEFAETRSLNWFERWIAPFDEGTGHHGEGAYDEAIVDYEAALEVVPDREECTVRINLALAHEAVGDALQADGGNESAIESWQAGIDVLAEGDCPQASGRGEEQTRDAEAVDKRLREKIEQQEQQQPQEPPPPSGGEPEDEGEEPRDPRQERLERNNQEGLDQRREDQELYEDQDFTRPYSW